MRDLVEVQQRSVLAKSGAKEPAERTDDPVRMYQREDDDPQAADQARLAP
jgi:hypothetical protein